MFQFTRPHWGATRRRPQDLRQAAVSIHAPALGRDDHVLRFAAQYRVSIHAPALGRDPMSDVR